jgi:hypothetical protein
MREECKLQESEIRILWKIFYTKKDEMNNSGDSEMHIL